MAQQPAQLLHRRLKWGWQADLPLCPANMPLLLSALWAQEGGKLRLQLMPLDGSTAGAMAAAGYHPFLELTLGTSKSLLSVLRHLGSKWQRAAPPEAAAAATTSSGGGGGGGSPLFVHPPAECLITLRGICWGGPDCDSQLKVGAGAQVADRADV